MERVDKIFMGLALVALVGLFVHQRPAARKGWATPARSRLNVSATPDNRPGPAYMLSALPARRSSDDFVSPVSYYEGDAIYSPEEMQ